MSKSNLSRREPEPPPTITDKRHTARPMPTAQELLDETEQDMDGNVYPAMTQEEKDALLAQQASELEGIPYEGAGVQVEAVSEPPKYLTAFTVLIPRDGPPEVIPPTIPLVTADGEDDDPEGRPAYEIDRDLVGRDLYLACTEILWNIQTSEQAKAGVIENMRAAQAMSHEARARADAQAALRPKKKH